MASVTLNPTADTHLDSKNSSANRDSNTIFVVGEDNTDTLTGRTLIKFPITANVPSTATVTAVRLRLYLDGERSSNNRTMRIHRVLLNWVSTEATWLIYSTGNTWDTAGCSNQGQDYDGTELANYAFSASETTGEYKNIDFGAGGVAAIQDIVDGTWANDYGFILFMDTQLNDMMRFQSSEGANPPELIITYTVAESGLIHPAVYLGPSVAMV